MIIACPNCGTKFNFPEDKARPNAKMRCSVCKHVFVPQDADKQDSSEKPLDNIVLGFSNEQHAEKAKKSSKKGLFSLLFVMLCLFGGGYYVWFHTPYIKNMLGTENAPVPVTDLSSRITLSDVRQYPVNNDKIGPITVIEGKAVNGFADSREMIRIEAALYDANGQMVTSKQQLAGNAVSLFQLQMLGEQELEQALTNNLGVLTYNTNVPPAGEVPFMLVFYNPPPEAAEFGVKVLEAQIPPQ